MKRKTKHLLELDLQVLLTALQNERPRLVDSIRAELKNSLNNIEALNAHRTLPATAGLMADAQDRLTRLDNAIAELKEQIGMDDGFLDRSIFTDFAPDDIPF